VIFRRTFILDGTRYTAKKQKKKILPTKIESKGCVYFNNYSVPLSPYTMGLY